MLKPINTNTNSFRVDTKTVNRNGEYRDPLMKWPLRGAAFTNEVGEALRPLIGNYATLSWAPALLYIGADIYDKYKNNKTEYSPDSQRCLKQAIFQGMASIFLPLVAVKAGQGLFSLFGMLSKDKLTINAKEQVDKLAQEFVANGQMRAHRHNDEQCVKDFMDIVANNIDYKKQKQSVKNPLKKIHLQIQDSLSLNKKANIDKYAESVIKKLIKMRKELIDPSLDGSTDKLHKYYNKALEQGQTRNVAVKSALNKHLCKSALKGRFIKTIGGFIALGLAIKPIDNFVEHVLIGKVIEPRLDKYKNPD